MCKLELIQGASPRFRMELDMTVATLCGGTKSPKKGEAMIDRPKWTANRMLGSSDEIRWCRMTVECHGSCRRRRWQPSSLTASYDDACQQRSTVTVGHGCGRRGRQRATGTFNRHDDLMLSWTKPSSSSLTFRLAIPFFFIFQQFYC